MVAASVTAALPSLGCGWLGFCSGTGLAPVPHLCDLRRLQLHLRRQLHANVKIYFYASSGR